MNAGGPHLGSLSGRSLPPSRLRAPLLLLAVVVAADCTTVHVHLPEGKPSGDSPAPPDSPPAPPDDRDGDGYPPPEDCDDGDPAVHPGALDLCGDGRDWDCSGGEELACVGVDLKVPLFRPTAIARLADSIVVGFTFALERGEPQLRLYSADLELGPAMALPRARSVEALLVRRTDEGLKLWVADEQANLLYRLPCTDRPSIALSERGYRIARGRPLAPRALAYMPAAARPAADLLVIGGRHGAAAWSAAVSSAGSRSLPDAPPNPAHVATTADDGGFLVASEPDRTLRAYEPDRFGEPVLQRSVALPGVPRDLATLPGRAVVLLATGVVELDLEAGAIDGDAVPIPGKALRLAVDPEGRWAYVVTSKGVLHVLDRKARAVVRKIDLTRARASDKRLDATPTAILEDRGRVLVLLAGNRAQPRDPVDSFLVAVEP